MTTRRQFVQSIPAFAVAANMLDGDAATAAPAPVAPAAGHFHPKGKPPSEFTKAVLRKARQSLPFDDTRDFDEQRKGLIAPIKDLTIKTDAGDVVWDMTRFQFLDQKDEFDSVHPTDSRSSTFGSTTNTASPPAPANMDVDGGMIIAVEEKRIAIVFENLRHRPSVPGRGLGAPLLRGMIAGQVPGRGFVCHGPLPNTARGPRANSCGLLRIGK
jgi:hypothetical protein